MKIKYLKLIKKINRTLRAPVSMRLSFEGMIPVFVDVNLAPNRTDSVLLGAGYADFELILHNGDLTHPTL